MIAAGGPSACTAVAVVSRCSPIERHAEEPLPEEERRRKSALAKREETALLAVRREIADIPKNGTFFMQNFVPGYERGKPIEGLPCLPPCTHKFGSNAGEGQVSRFVAVSQ